MTTRVRPIRPARDRTHVDRKRQQKIEGTVTLDEWVDGYMERHGAGKSPDIFRCPDCGGLGTGHKDFCIHRR